MLQNQRLSLWTSDCFSFVVATTLTTPLERADDAPEPPEPKGRWHLPRFIKYILIAASAVALACLGVVFGFYVHYARLADRNLKAGPFASIDSFYAAPETVHVGERMAVKQLVALLRRAGADSTQGNAVGRLQILADGVEFHPGPQSVTGQPAVLIRISNDKIAQITSLSDRAPLHQYVLEPALITSVSEQNREKRRLIKFRDIPQNLVHAIISAEDKRFFQHAGFDPMRILKAAWVDFRSGRKEQGASTISMQLSRSFWLDSDKSWRRKFAELLITMRLEERLSKEQIFEDYCNQVYLGRTGTYSINGFGAAAIAFFGKDIRQLTLPEAATLAGIIQRPSYYSPLRNPEHAVDRRNLVLTMMRQNGYITDAEYADTVQARLTVASHDGEAADAPYFVDLVNDELQSDLSDSRGGQTRVYTTLDMNLQRAAADAVRVGMQEVDKRLGKLRHKGAPLPQAQVALIALDPHTGEVKALIGGRDYTASQLDHALAKRQPGSVFKPFVYAAALNTAVEGGSQIFTPASTIVDEPTTFASGTYSPGNFGHTFYGTVTLRSALAHSINVATVKLAEMVGYDAVVRMARRAGLNEDIRATPAVALGSYDATPFEIAGAYTVFANQGVFVKPRLISTVRDHEGGITHQNEPDTRKALDPRVAYLMVNLLGEVMRSGTAAGVRSRGFIVPAAGKTGTSHDGWFAGFTSNLLCVVWIGFDDNQELHLEGAKSALPVWTEFMKRALEYYPDAKPFARPDGITSAQICPESGELASELCPSKVAEVFIAGSEPQDSCAMHNSSAGDPAQVAGGDGAVTGVPISLPQN